MNRRSFFGAMAGLVAMCGVGRKAKGSDFGARPIDVTTFAHSKPRFFTPKNGQELSAAFDEAQEGDVILLECDTPYKIKGQRTFVCVHP